MQYTFEQLKNQVISLDFTKFDEIYNLNLNELKQHVNFQIEKTKEEIDKEFETFNLPEIKNIDQLFKNDKYLVKSIKLPTLFPTLYLLNRIKVDLDKIIE
ncbi:hypothetical protein [Kaistella faecalis]|uniref:hypothetical protein n=1 Tax=Kaistella faecalis TaxID=2852098 RepID=UPI001C48EC1A|nr:hypothetical protein [Chryseobacterium faecale]UFK97402.1 hypothetical protein LL667_10600 [Chryseobacterium faecale]